MYEACTDTQTHTGRHVHVHMCCCPSVVMTNHVYSICSACMQIFELAAGSECKSSAVNVPVKAYSVVVMHRLCTVYGRCIMQPILDTPCNSLVFSASYSTNHLGTAIVLF